MSASRSLEPLGGSAGGLYAGIAYSAVLLHLAQAWQAFGQIQLQAICIHLLSGGLQPHPVQEHGHVPPPQASSRRLTLAGSAKGLRQVTKELPSCPRMAVSTVGSITSGRRPVPLHTYSQVPSRALCRVTVPCSTVPAESARSAWRSSSCQGRLALGRVALSASSCTRPMQPLKPWVPCLP